MTLMKCRKKENCYRYYIATFHLHEDTSPSPGTRVGETHGKSDDVVAYTALSLTAGGGGDAVPRISATTFLEEAELQYSKGGL